MSYKKIKVNIAFYITFRSQLSVFLSLSIYYYLCLLLAPITNNLLKLLSKIPEHK